MFSLAVAQAAVEYVGLVFHNVGEVLGRAANTTFTFIATPRGLFVVLGVMLLLALTVGRRRRL